jgi:hypothetical protein
MQQDMQPWKAAAMMAPAACHPLSAFPAFLSCLHLLWHSRQRPDPATPPKKPRLAPDHTLHNLTCGPASAQSLSASFLSSSSSLIASPTGGRPTTALALVPTTAPGACPVAGAGAGGTSMEAVTPSVLMLVVWVVLIVGAPVQVAAKDSNLESRRSRTSCRTRGQNMWMSGTRMRNQDAAMASFLYRASCTAQETAK